MKRHRQIFRLVSITALVSLLYVRFRFLAVELSYEVGRFQKEKTQLENKKHALTLELATLKRPKRVESIAEKHLGLKKIQPTSTVIFLKEDPSP